MSKQTGQLPVLLRAAVLGKTELLESPAGSGAGGDFTCGPGCSAELAVSQGLQQGMEARCGW